MHNTAKTSLTHPLQIAELSNPKFAGQIGITFCPGKKQRSAYSGQWDRDLGIDLDAIREWGASAVVTLVEDHELEALAVPGMGDAVRARGMVWHHLPIRDVSVPGERFEAQWRDVGAELRQLVKSGSKVLVHCKGGLGRAGTIAARLLVELGVPSDTAVAQVRRVRPGAIETSAQLAYVLACKPMAESIPDTSVDAIRDRAIGALKGIGDQGAWRRGGIDRFYRPSLKLGFSITTACPQIRIEGVQKSRGYSNLSFSMDTFTGIGSAPRAP